MVNIFPTLIQFNAPIGQILTTAVWALDAADEPKLTTASNILNWISSIVPTYVASMVSLESVEALPN